MTSPQSERPVVGAAFRCVMPLRWGDLDAQDHINNTVFFRFFEEARVQLFHQAGLSMPARKVGLLAHASCDFLKPLHWPGTVVVRLILRRIGRTSLQFDATIERDDDPGVVCARGVNVIVGADAATGQPQPWTAAELAALAPCFVLE